MPKVISAKLEAGPHRFALVVARFNEFITSKLVDGAVDALVRHGADPFQAKELALAYGTVAAALVLAGAGPLSLDALILKRWRGRAGESEASE